jgi:Holliday junction resolvase RusA-like endonuclease
VTMHRFPLPPSANKYWRLAKGRLIVSDEARRYKTTLQMLARCDGAKMLSGPVAVTLRVFRARKSGDLDNKIKCLLDSMEGVFFTNDAQVKELHAYLDDDRFDPRIEVEVTSGRD